MILEKTFQFLISNYQVEPEKLIITNVRIGVFLTAIELSDGSCGIASTCIDTHLQCNKKNRDFGDFSPSRIKGKSVRELFEFQKNTKVIDTLKIATLNAISSGLINESNYKIIEKTDPIDLIDLSQQKTITLVGAFQSYIKKIAETQNKLYVLELDENTLNEEQKQYYVPAQEYEKILAISDIVIITGLTLVNNTFDNLIQSIPESTLVIITGPSTSLIPDILFQKNVNIIGATRITNTEKLFEIVSEGGTGFHLFNYCAEKYCIINEK